MLELLLVERPRKPLPPDDMTAVGVGFVGEFQSYLLFLSSRLADGSGRSSAGLASSVSPRRGLERGLNSVLGGRAGMMFLSLRFDEGTFRLLLLLMLFDERGGDHSMRARRSSRF